MSYNITDYQPYDFANRRHIGPSPLETIEMLNKLGKEHMVYSKKIVNIDVIII